MVFALIQLSTLQLFCNKSQFFQGQPVENNTFLKISISKQGIEAFIDNCIDDMLGMLSMVPFGTLDMEMLGFHVYISDISVYDINLQNYSIYPQPDKSFVKINNLNVIFQGRIQIQQEIFPYISIDTIGKVQVDGVTLQILCNLKPSDECPDHLKFSVLDLQITYNKIQILADDLLIFQSLIPFISDQLLSQVGKILLDPFLDRINGYLYNISGDMYSGDIVFDQRISNVDIDQYGLVVNLVGLMPEMNSKHGKNTIVRRNYSNDQIQYQANIQVVRDMVQRICTECNVSIVNRGILLSIPNENNILLTLQPQVTQHNNDKLIKVVSMLFQSDKPHTIVTQLNKSPYAFYSVYPGNFTVLYENSYQKNIDGEPLEEIIVLASFQDANKYEI